eukprot:12013779-Karenia_brevis.AAC.1
MLAPGRPAGSSEDVEVVPDVNLAEPDVAAPDDLTLNYRRMTKEQLVGEAKSKRHKMCHFPCNPYCKGCCEGNLMQRRLPVQVRRKTMAFQR